MRVPSGTETLVTPTLARKLNRLVERSLLTLDHRWPTHSLISDYRNAHSDLVQSLESGTVQTWPNDLSEFLYQRLGSELTSRLGCGLDSVQSLLHELSCLAAMLMHLEVQEDANQRLLLINTRRTRTIYGTYPTSPQVAKSMAKYVWNALSDSCDSRAKSLRMVDPTMEGGPTLLELAFHAHTNKNRRGLSSRKHDKRFTLVGVDKNRAAARIVQMLLEAWQSSAELKEMHLDIRCQDALDSLEEAEPFDAIVNNPPWGAETDGANGTALEQLGPYVGYRDPYIAFVSLGLKRLAPASPFAFVLPFQFLTADSAGQLREEVLDNAQLDNVVLLPRSVFPRATVKTVLLLGRRRKNGERRRSTLIVRYPMTQRLTEPSIPQIDRLGARVVNRLGSSPWMSLVQPAPHASHVASIREVGELARIVLGIEPYRRGRGRPKQTEYELAVRPFTFDRQIDGTTPVVRSRDVTNFHVRNAGEFIKIGRWLAAPGRHLEFANRPRVFVREICGRDGSLVSAVAPRGVVARYGVFTIVADRIKPAILCALLNSTQAAKYVRSHCASFHKESFGRITAGDLRQFPVPTALIDGEGGEKGVILRKELSKLAKRASLLAANGRSGALGEVSVKTDSLIEEVFSLPSVRN